MVFGRDFFWVVLQFGAWMRGPGFKIGLFGNCHAANGVSPEVFPPKPYLVNSQQARSSLPLARKVVYKDQRLGPIKPQHFTSSLVTPMRV